MSEPTATPTHGAPLPAPPNPSRRWVTLVLCTVIFVAGGVLGSGLTVLLRLEEWPRPRKTLEERRARLTQRIAEKLGLDAKQTEVLRALVGARLDNIEIIRQEILPEMKQEAAQLNRDLLPVLNEKQKKQWARLYATLYEKWFRQPLPTPATPPKSKKHAPL